LAPFSGLLLRSVFLIDHFGIATQNYDFYYGVLVLALMMDRLTASRTVGWIGADRLSQMTLSFGFLAFEKLGGSE
jgi:hypothetical protein